MERSETIGHLALALAKAQGEMPFAKKDSSNPYFHSSYADLASIVDAIKEPLAKNELAYAQATGFAGDYVIVETILIHSSGEWLSSKLSMRPVRETKDGIVPAETPQGIGSCITYARRYGLQAIVGIPAADDDGEAASGRGPAKPPIAGSTKQAEQPGAAKSLESTKTAGPAKSAVSTNPQEPTKASPAAAKASASPMGLIEPVPQRAGMIAGDWVPTGMAVGNIHTFRRRVEMILDCGWKEGSDKAFQEEAKSLAIALRERGVSDLNRRDAYIALCGVDSGLEMNRAQMLLLRQNIGDGKWVTAVAVEFQKQQKEATNDMPF